MREIWTISVPLTLATSAERLSLKSWRLGWLKFYPVLWMRSVPVLYKGTSIATHIALAQELIRDINIKVTRGNVAFKLDMANAYDRLEWRSLRTMKAFGFSSQARDLIYRNICNIWYSFKINGEYYCSFRSFCGVRQGDPLSPLLFMLAQQVMSNNLKRLTTQLDIKPHHIGRNEKPITHLFLCG